MSALLDVILPVFLVIGFGYAAARARLFDAASVDGVTGRVGHLGERYPVVAVSGCCVELG